jgi:hypothetical protein
LVENVGWLERSDTLLPGNVPNLEIPKIIELQEIKAMLYENIQAWYEEARQKGEIKGQANMLIGLLEKKFGGIDEQTRSLIYQLDEDNLRACSKRLLSAQSLSDVIKMLSLLYCEQVSFGLVL